MREKYFSTIKSKTADLEHIIEQFFLFSKLDMNEFPLTLWNTAVVPLVEDMPEEISEEYSSRGLDIHFTGTPDADSALPAAIVSADTIWLRNVIVNVLENSNTYKTKERGRVEVSVKPAGDEIAHNGIALRFADGGPGVAPEAIKKLFSEFYRTDPSRDKKGAGLAISARLIEHTGGACRAELPPSGGLAITDSLPLVKEGAA